MNKKEEVIKILKQFEQRDYKLGGVSLAPEMYNAVAEKIVKLFAIPVVVGQSEQLKCDCKCPVPYKDSNNILACRKCHNEI